MIFSFVKDYLRHRLTAKTQRGLHSTFIYRLVDEVVYDYSPRPVYATIETNKRGYLPSSRRKGNRPKADQLLYRLVNYFNPATILEIGTGRGISKLYMAKAAPDAKLVSLEYDGSLQHAAAKLQTVDFAFINYYEPALLYNCFETLLPTLKPHSIVVICNIYGSPVSKRAFQDIKAHPAITATIDLFWMQLVFFRDDQVMEHFKLKF